MQGLLVTGTDTDVGKTHLTAGLLRVLRRGGINAAACKPVCSGSAQQADGTFTWNDVEKLYAAVDGEFPRDRICPQRFHAPLAPPLAAHREGHRIDLQSLLEGVEWWKNRVDVLLVEGVGGWLCPLTDTECIQDFAVKLGFPVLLVAQQKLGTINHTLLSVNAISNAGLTLAGVVLNQTQPYVAPSADQNLEAIKSYGSVENVWSTPFTSENELPNTPALIRIGRHLQAILQ
ncbi:MAG: dethiobiotin synthase [Planctomycetaceae bacterium]|nr:dethiobiotin synthase [Planctomycetaceae bacterium]MCB9949820.1 dethiobiotin synthase [Planctomycetaceae bacterium]